MNKFADILQNAKKLFTSGSTAVAIGVDVGSSSIKIVEVKKKEGKAYLETYGAIALGPYAGLSVGQVTNLPGEKLAIAIKDLLKEINATTTTGALAIPSSASLIFTVELPGGIKGEDLKTAVATEARRFIPVPINEVSLDSWEIPTQESFLDNPEDEVHEGLDKSVAPLEDKTKVLVAAIHNDTIAKYQDLVNQAQMDARFFEIETFSAIRSLVEHELVPMLIIDFGASKTKLSIVEHGIIRVFHVVNRGSQDITLALSKALSISFDQAEDMKKRYGLQENAPDLNAKEVIRTVIDYIFGETTTVILEYEKKTGKNLKKIVATGGGALLYGLQEYASKTFRAEVVLGNAFTKTEAPAFLEQMLAATGPEFTVSVGLALRVLS